MYPDAATSITDKAEVKALVARAIAAAGGPAKLAAMTGLNRWKIWHLSRGERTHAKGTYQPRLRYFDQFILEKVCGQVATKAREQADPSSAVQADAGKTDRI